MGLSLDAARKKPGVSMPGGRYPVRNDSDLKHAERAVGRTPPAERPAVERHIRERAKDLGEKVTRKMPGTTVDGAHGGNGMVKSHVG